MCECTHTRVRRRDVEGLPLHEGLLPARPDDDWLEAQVRAAKDRARWPPRGGRPTWHARRGPWPRDPPRTPWQPPPGWTPPAKPEAAHHVRFSSWYDRGERLRRPAPRGLAGSDATPTVT